MVKRSKKMELPADWKPIQAVPDPILNGPYDEPTKHWIYSDGVPEVANGRRPGSYFYTETAVATGQRDLLAEETRDELAIVNGLRRDVSRWRKSDYRGVSNVTRELLRWWKRDDQPRRMFFCQIEAIETLIYLLELAIPGRLGASGYRKFDIDQALLSTLLAGEKPPPPYAGEKASNWPRLIDPSGTADEIPLRRLGCKMATGSGKTAVMAMVIIWAFLNRSRSPSNSIYPHGVLVVAPNLTVKERLQVLRADHLRNIYDYFDLVPTKYKEQLNAGKVLIVNWNMLGLKSEHREGNKSYNVVQKGQETPEAFTRNRLGELVLRLPILVLNDEGHHCWRPNLSTGLPEEVRNLAPEEKDRIKKEKEEARVWLAGLDRINNSGLAGADSEGRPRSSILACVDLSATPFYIAGSGHPTNSPFPWLVSDFGLGDAIECGIVKIPRLPTADDQSKKTELGSPDPKYFRLWKNIVDNLKPHEKIAKRPKPEAVYKRAEGALKTLASQWKAQFDKKFSSGNTEGLVPPVLIVVCDNTALSEIVFEKISGEHSSDVTSRSKKSEPTKASVYGDSKILAEFTNGPGFQYTVRIDSKLLAKIETVEGESKDEAAQRLRELIGTIGKMGASGEQVRCVVSVSMLTEGWDANNVTHVLGIRAFDSQLLCEQVVGRGLRRENYNVNPDTGLLEAEYVDVYGIPFSLIPYKGKPPGDKTTDPIYHRIFSVPERAPFEIRVPVVESYTYDIRDSGIRCDVDALPEIYLLDEPTKVWLTPTRGYREDGSRVNPSDRVEQTREAYYRTVRVQQVIFLITKDIIDELVSGASGSDPDNANGRRLARHQIFGEVKSILDRYIKSGKIHVPAGADMRELAITSNAQMVSERVREGIVASVASKEHPLLPVINRYSEWVTTDGVEDQTTRRVERLTKSHLNAAIIHSDDEVQAIEILEELECVECFTPNSRKIGIQIPYRYDDAASRYEPDFVVKLQGGQMLILEIKGEGGLIHGDSRDRAEAKKAATNKWCAAINNAQQYGSWAYVFCDDIRGLRSQIVAYADSASATLPFDEVRPLEGDHFKTCVPLTTLSRASERLGEGQLSFAEVVQSTQEWVAWVGHPIFEEGMFVARVQGDAMAPEIKHGDYCLFRAPTKRTRTGRIALVSHTGIKDPLTGGHYTLRTYTSERAIEEEGFQQTKVVLKANNMEFEPIVIMSEVETDVRIAGEFVTVVSRKTSA